MKNFGKIIVFAVMLGVLTAPLCRAQEVPARPQGYVNDYAGVLPVSEQNRIHALAAELQRKTGAQMAVVTVRSTAPDTIEQYAVRLFEQWGIGQRGKDNGVLLLVAVDDRRVRIEVGYGLEGALTDALSKSIIERFMIPGFRQGLYGQGISAGSAAVASVIAQSYGVSVTGQEQQVYRALHRGRRGQGSPVVSFIIFVVMMILFILNPRLFFYMMMFSMIGGGRRGYWGGSGGGFGGGFGGFGGGLSGGGGASGGW